MVAAEDLAGILLDDRGGGVVHEDGGACLLVACADTEVLELNCVPQYEVAVVGTTLAGHKRVTIHWAPRQRHRWSVSSLREMFPYEITRCGVSLALMSLLAELASKQGIQDVYEVVAEYELYLEDGPRPLGVRVLRDTEGQHYVKLSHHYQAPGAAGPYYPSKGARGDSVLSALESVWSNELAFYSGDPNGTWHQV